VPRHRASAVAWLSRSGVKTVKAPSSGGFCGAVNFTDLPEPVRLAYLARQAERSGLAAGVQDDAAHLALMAKPLGVQSAAHQRAAILVFVEKHRRAGLSWPQIAALFGGAGFGEGPSEQTVERWFKRVENVDPINWGPALAPDWKPRAADAPMSEEAFSWFKDIVGLSGKNGTRYPLRWAYRDTAEQARKEGWLWPSYETVRRRFLDLSATGRRTLMLGETAAASSLTQYQPRSTEALRAMEQVIGEDGETVTTVANTDGGAGAPWLLLDVSRAVRPIIRAGNGSSMSSSSSPTTPTKRSSRMTVTSTASGRG
jgi:putative transposase